MCLKHDVESLMLLLTFPHRISHTVTLVAFVIAVCRYVLIAFPRHFSHTFTLIVFVKDYRYVCLQNGAFHCLTPASMSKVYDNSTDLILTLMSTVCFQMPLGQLVPIEHLTMKFTKIEIPRTYPKPMKEKYLRIIQNLLIFFSRYVYGLVRLENYCFCHSSKTKD